MKLDVTCVYYTSNREEPLFQERMQKTLLETLGDIPLVSVSHKSMNFGKNICVGEMVPSSHNAFRQMQLGAIEAKTKFICVAEADTLYPREYFEFEPKEDNLIYQVRNIWVLVALAHREHSYFKKRYAEGAIVVGREYIIKVVDSQLRGKPFWTDTTDYEKNFIGELFKCSGIDSFHNTIPVVQFKTDNNMHRKTPYIPGSGVRTLPFWGDSHELMRKYL